jgi:hypothetical protein
MENAWLMLAQARGPTEEKSSMLCSKVCAELQYLVMAFLTDFEFKYPSTKSQTWWGLGIYCSNIKGEGVEHIEDWKELWKFKWFGQT